MLSVKISRKFIYTATSSPSISNLNFDVDIKLDAMRKPSLNKELDKLNDFPPFC